MARAHRLATILTILASLYALLFFAILPVPFVDNAVVEKVLPTVRLFAACSSVPGVGSICSVDHVLLYQGIAECRSF